MKTATIKITKIFSVILVAMYLVSLVGCAKPTQQFTKVGQTIPIGDKEYDVIFFQHKDDWGQNVYSEHLIESTVEEQDGAVECIETRVTDCCQPQQQYINQVSHCQCCNGQQQYASAQPVRQRRVKNTRVVDNNHQGGNGWVNNMMPNAALGGGIAGAGALMRPSRINNSSYGGSGGSASSASAAASASAASAH